MVSIAGRETVISDLAIAKHLLLLGAPEVIYVFRHLRFQLQGAFSFPFPN